MLGLSRSNKYFEIALSGNHQYNGKYGTGNSHGFRMKSSKLDLKETIQFSDILKQEYALFEDLIIKKDIDWNENISSDLSVIGDKALIQKVINNLISNAISYSPEVVTIYLTAFAEDGGGSILLENTGVRIPDSEIPKLFDAFYRVEHSRNEGNWWEVVWDYTLSKPF